MAKDEDQTVSVTARKALRDKQLKFRINGGRTHDDGLRAWKGGDVYGGEDNNWFDEYRAKVDGARPGDTVEVWFTGLDRSDKQVSSEHFTYKVAERPRADVLVIAEEGAKAVHAKEYVDALRANGTSAAVWDVAVQGVPHHLGVLSHFGTAVHYTGAKVPGGETQLAVRDFLNEGGKLIEAGELAGGNAQVGRAVTNDFSQYYLGAYSRASAKGATGFTGAGALNGAKGGLGDAADNPLNAPGSYTATSDTLAAAQFPQFKSAQAGQYAGVVNPYAPFAGAGMAAAVHTDSDWKRLVRTIDLTGVTAADKPQLKMALNWNTEDGYDHAVLEAHTTGGRGLDHAARRGRPEQLRRPGGLRGRVLHQRPPVPAQLPHAGRRRLHRAGHQRYVEQLHRILRRLEAGRLRPERVRGQEGGGVPVLHHRPGLRRPRGLRGRGAAVRRRHRPGRRGLRDLPRDLDRAGRTGRKPRDSGGLVPLRGAVQVLRGHHNASHGSARLRPGTRAGGGGSSRTRR
ncbi:hypothetical protein GCM10020254_62410 [Streptomyces goshikiensis]